MLHKDAHALALDRHAGSRGGFAQSSAQRAHRRCNPRLAPARDRLSQIKAISKALAEGVPTKQTFTKANLEANLDVIQRATELICEETQRAWVAQLHKHIGRYVTSLVDLSACNAKLRRAVDPKEDLLWAACDALIVLIERHNADTCASIGPHVLHALARIASCQNGHDGEAVLVAMQVHHARRHLSPNARSS